MAETTFRYLSIDMNYRSSVREPIPPPTMKLVRGGGSVVQVELNEPQLLAIIKDAAKTLDHLRQSRNAVQP